MYKLRSDNFLCPAEKNDVMKIQEQFLKYYKDKFDELNSIEEANHVLSIYASIAFDEGYRKAIEETKDIMGNINKIKAKPRKKDFFEYVEEGDLKNSLNLCKRRMKSKRQRKHREEYCKSCGIEFEEEQFTLSIVIHTYFEAGYLKAQSLEQQAKILTGDGEKASIIVDMFKECFDEYVEKQEYSND